MKELAFSKICPPIDEDLKEELQNKQVFLDDKKKKVLDESERLSEFVNSLRFS